ncbi:MAG TPA: hypothetical protein VHC86_11390 [Opitutaceae bacterium]|nr:hypothetical protein [Opitutaceae bacterium]
MASEHAIQIFGFINLLIIGLSMLLRPIFWSNFFAWLARQGEAGGLAYGCICLSFGSLVVAFHRVWHGLLVLYTLAGWVDVVLGIVCLLLPATALRLVSWAATDRPIVCRGCGLICLIVAVVIAAALISGGSFVL